MRTGPNPRRLRGRNSGRRNQSSRTQNFESSGPETKVRGNAQQVVEKYLQLARDATLAGNPVMAENFFQHAEHYYRIQAANGTGNENRNDGRSQNDRQDSSENGTGNGADVTTRGNGAAETSEQPDVEPDSGKEISQGAGETDGSENQTQETG